MLTSVIAAPRHTMNYFLLIIGGLILAALAFTIFARVEFPHPVLVAKPMLVLAVILAVLVLNRLAFLPVV
jgi:hypothetical protein